MYHGSWLHVSWIMKLFSRMASNEDQKIIQNWWKAADIKEVTELGSSKMKQLGFFCDFDPLLNTPSISVDQKGLAEKDLSGKELQRLDLDEQEGE